MGRIKGFTTAGAEHMQLFNNKKDALYRELFNSVKHLEDDEMVAAFKEGEIDITKQLREWNAEILESSSNVKKQEVEDQRQAEVEQYLSPRELQKIREAALNIEEERELQDILIQQEKDQEYLRIVRKVIGKIDEDGNRILKDTSGHYPHRPNAIIPGGRHQYVSKAYDKAEEHDIYNSDTEKVDFHAQLHASWKAPNRTNEISPSNRYKGTSPRDRAYFAYAYTRKFGFRKDSVVDRAAKRTQMVNNYNRYGISAKELINDSADFVRYWQENDNFVSNITISECLVGFLQ